MRKPLFSVCLLSGGAYGPYNMRHTYATAMLMAGMTPAFCARELGHSVEMFLRTYAKWVDNVRDDAEMARLESSLAVPQKTKART